MSIRRHSLAAVSRTGRRFKCPGHITVNACQNAVFSLNTIGKVYSLEYTDIQNVFFTPHHVGCCTILIRGQCCFLGSSFTNAIRGHCSAKCVPTMGTLGSHCCTTINSNGTSGTAVKKKCDGQTDRHGRAYKVFFADARA
jgi:hypothetical protein